MDSTHYANVVVNISEMQINEPFGPNSCFNADKVENEIKSIIDLNQQVRRRMHPPPHPTPRFLHFTLISIHLFGTNKSWRVSGDALVFSDKR